MLILIAKSQKYINEYPNKYIGRLFIPDLQSKAEDTFDSNYIYGVDNGCFVEFKESKFRLLLEKIQGQDNCKFVCCPDVVGKFKETMELFDEWQPIIKETGQPVALVLQDGATKDNIPFDKFDSIFVGGTTEYKLGQEVRDIIKIAKQKNKWVHIGRVNSNKRINYCLRIGVDSIDGLSFSKFHKTHLPRGIALLQQESLLETWEQ